MNIPSECRIEDIVPNHAMILPHDANPKPDGIFGKDSRLFGRRARIAEAPAGRLRFSATAKIVILAQRLSQGPLRQVVLRIAANETSIPFSRPWPKCAEVIGTIHFPIAAANSSPH